jgi:hypothetical protein
MSEKATTYSPEIACQVRAGDADWEVVVTVEDEDGRKQHLSVSKGMVDSDKDRNWLGIGVVQIDYPRKRVLVELPVEADSGANRLWMPFSSFRPGGAL